MTRFVSFRPRPIRRASIGPLALLAFALAAPVPAQTAAQTGLPVIELNAGLYRIEAEVANSERTRETGLMFRRQMAAGHGMLFVFPQPTLECMWMKNTLIPLSVAFIDADGEILNIEEMAAQTENSHCSEGPARYALEMSRGWFSGKGITAGARLQGLEKAPPAE